MEISTGKQLSVSYRRLLSKAVERIDKFQQILTH